MLEIFDTVRCPTRCNAVVCERSGDGTRIKKRCRCGRMLLIDEVGTVKVIEEAPETRISSHTNGQASLLALAKGT